MPVPNLYSYLVPFLTDEEGLHDPMQWMGEYGMYLTPYDETQEELLVEQTGLASETLEPGAWTDIQNVQRGLAASGFAGSYMGDRAGEALEKTAQGMSLTRLQGLNRQKALQKAYESDMYASLHELVGLDAFLEEGPGWGAPLTGSNLQEFEDMMAGGWSNWNEAYDYYGEEYVYGTYGDTGAICNTGSIFYNEGECHELLASQVNDTDVPGTGGEDYEEYGTGYGEWFDPEWEDVDWGGSDYEWWDQDWDQAS
jgi:hypothetical protein